MQKEITALEANNTWVLTTLPSGKTLVDCKWVYRLKFKSDGTLERYKARLVARGFTQVEGLDYHDTFAPVAKMTTVRCLLAVAAARKWPIYQLDVDNAFLHGSLDEEVYMKLPIGFYKKEKAAGQVCKLVKSLYGLKQASKQWFAKFSEVITDFGFQRNLNDYSLFTMKKNGDFLILLVYVDDVVITGTSSTLISEVKQYIHDKFRIKDLGFLKYFLGLEVARSDDGIFLNQRKYAIELLEEHNLVQSKPAKSPMNAKHKLSLSTEALLPDALPYTGFSASCSVTENTRKAIQALNLRLGHSLSSFSFPIVPINRARLRHGSDYAFSHNCTFHWCNLQVRPRRKNLMM
ncbi:unnamed protein product [Rhodiola kirilowii]